MSDELNDVILGGEVQTCIRKALVMANEEVTLMSINDIFNSRFEDLEVDYLSVLCSMYYAFGRMAGEFSNEQMEKIISILDELRLKVINRLSSQPAKLQQPNLPLAE